MSVGDKMRLFKDLYQYRELLKTNVKKEIRGKYKGSFLGVLWSFINPLLQVLVYAIVFPFIMRSSPDHFIVYLVIGIIPWNFFITCMNQGMITVRMNAGIIKKVYFPREILPLSVTLSGLVNFFISCIVIILFCIFGGVGPLSWHVILVPIFAFIQFLFTSGLVFAFSAINIYIKDTEGLDQLPDNLKEMALLRLEHPEAPLKELGTYLDPPVGKSGVNHRLRKICEEAERLRG